ncbi:phosphoenolpyruvate carboxylase [Thalassotalea sp. HSM 43]|uniref:phosphoenolpyruvate carboxylase n=1 Tax=Thalassotalea sp. HSM 43 TaxID=2552945 RepID=UPI00107FE2F9|nr:phosphoenolpyruvate carboxylase [Thalassotalea sp. HSM 43]QBY05465.1 phosphoenolpyruvate carboxylase [Thalassotalea sp. HSM 43]
MSSQLNNSGVKFLKALAKHSDIIMQAYLSGRVSEMDFDINVLEKLMELGVLWRPEPGEDLRLRSSVRALLENSLKDERNRQLDANIGSKLATIKTVTSHYKEALHHHADAEAEVYLEDLAEQVYTLVDSLKSSVRSLWRRIHNEFGYVGSINAKIRENELAQGQLTQMRQQLEMFQFDELAALAGSNRELRRLLVVQLQKRHTEISQELSIAQAKLIELLGKFREYLHRSQLLKGFVLHHQQKPDYQIKDYSAQHQLPSLFNQAKAVIKPASIDVNNIEHEQVFAELVNHLRQVRHNRDENQQQRKAQNFAVDDIENIDIVSDGLKEAIEHYFVHVIDSAQRMSALEYHQWQKLDFDQEVWVYGVINGYTGLSAEEQEFFEIGVEGHPHPKFTGNFVIEDVELGLR